MTKRPSSDIDPRDLRKPAGQPRRGPRNRPKPSDYQARGRDDAEARVDGAPVNPGIILEPASGGDWLPTAPHGDGELWTLQLHAAFATGSPSVVQKFMDDLRDLCSEDYDAKHGWKTNESEWNAALAMVNDIQPQSIREAALAAQMVAVHWMQMRLAKDALNRGGTVLEKSASLASKLARTYAMQMETLQKERGRGPAPHRQEIHVTRENHIHYHDNRGKGSDENGTRPQETRAEAIEGCAKVLGHSEGNGQALPSSSREGQAGVPQARRGKSGRQEG